MDFKTLDISAYYIFNNRRYSYAAAYGASKLQKRSAGSWLLGFDFSHYNIFFDLERLPDKVKELQIYPWDSYRLKYDSINVIGGYAYNWVIGRHFLFNTTTMPGIGATRTRNHSSHGSEIEMSMMVRQMLSFTYNYRRFF